MTIVLLTMTAMLALTWRTWPEPIVDFGRELYVPWQLSQGKVLYRDIAYFNGPLSPYFNSLIFRVFGVSLMSLVWTNIAVLVAICVMLHRIIATIADELAATVGTCAFVLLLAVGQPGPIGNYNFITPYSHEMTLGLALSLAGILSLMRWIDTRKRRWVALCGALVGMVSLTKPEMFLALSIAAVVGIVLLRAWKDLLLFAACAFASPLIAVALLMTALPAHQAILGILGAYHWSMDSRITSLPFYQRVRGTFDIAESLQLLLWTSIGYLACFFTFTWIGRRTRGSDSNASQFIMAFAIMTVVLLLLHNFIPWEQVGRPIVLIVAGCVMGFAFPRPDVQRIARFVFVLFSLLLLAKTFLFVRLYHYGFASTAPALLTALAALLCWIPKWIERKSGSGAALKGATIAAVLATAGMHLLSDVTTVRQKTTLVGSGADAFYTTGAGDTVNRIVQTLKQTPAGSTVAIVPQGAMINYLARRPSSIPYIVQMPPEVIMFSQKKILDSFRAAPPDYVVYLDTETSEYGVAGYSVDFAKPMFDWIEQNYRPVRGDPEDAQLKWVMYERK
jgi:hypothetical protein